eukprot:COSAG01_NODE_48790_length_378_cov_0.544803_1_plen_33_part_01
MATLTQLPRKYIAPSLGHSATMEAALPAELGGL